MPASYNLIIINPKQPAASIHDVIATFRCLPNEAISTIRY